MSAESSANGSGYGNSSNCSRQFQGSDYCFCRPSTSRMPPACAVGFNRYSNRKSAMIFGAASYRRSSHNRPYCNELNPKSHSSFSKRLSNDSRFNNSKYDIMRSGLPSCNELLYSSVHDDLTYCHSLNRLSPCNITADGKPDRLPIITKLARQRKWCWKMSSLTTKPRFGWLLIFLIFALLAAFGIAAPLLAEAPSYRRVFVGIRHNENDFVNERMEYGGYYGSRRKRHTIIDKETANSEQTLMTKAQIATTINAKKSRTTTTTKNNELTTNFIDPVNIILPNIDDGISALVANIPNTLDDRNNSSATITADENVEMNLNDKLSKNNNDNYDDVVEFRRWVAFNNSEFAPLNDGRAGELFEIDLNRTHRVRLKCRAASRIVEPKLARVEWRRVGDDATLADTVSDETILELDVTEYFKREDYRCVAMFKPFDSQKGKTTMEGFPRTTDGNENDDQSMIQPPPLITSSRAVKLRVKSELRVVASPSIQSARSGDVVSLTCRRDGIETKSTADGSWRWSKNGVSEPLSDGDDEGAIRIYSTAYESKLHILRVDADAHAGDYRCRLSIGAGGATTTIQLRVDSDDALPPSSPLPNDELTSVDLRASGERLLECLHAGAVHVHWLRAAKKDDMDELLRLDADDATSSRTFVGEGSALRVNVAAAVAYFVCVATNAHGRRLLTRKFEVLVRDDLLQEDDSFITVSRSVGMRAKFNCPTYRTERIDTVGWLRNGRHFTGHPRVKITVKTKWKYNDTQLALSVVEPEDEGFYECVVTAADGGERRLRVRLHVNAPPAEVGRPTRLRADVDHTKACMRVTFRVPRSAGTPVDASRATYFLAYYPVDGDALLNNVPFNGAECLSVTATAESEKMQISSTAATPKIVINGQVVSAAEFGLDLSDDVKLSLPVDCTLTACDHTDHNLEAGLAYVLHVSMVLKRRTITPFSPPLIVHTWDPYASRALPLAIAYSTADRQLVLRWDAPTDELRDQVTGFDLDVADDRLDGRSAWKSHRLNVSAREYHISVGEARSAATSFSYRLRVVPLTRAGAPPKEHLQRVSNFAFTIADASLFGDGTPMRSPPRAFIAQQSAPGVARMRVSWNASQLSQAEQVIVRYAEARRDSQKRAGGDHAARLAHMRTRTAAAGDAEIELVDGLEVGAVYQVCAALQFVEQPTPSGFWQCARVSLVDDSGRLARIAARPLPQVIQCEYGNCHCEYLRSENVLRISWDTPVNPSKAIVTDDESSQPGAAYYVIHYKNNDSIAEAFEHTVDFEVVDKLPTKTPKNCALHATSRANFVDLPLSCTPTPFLPASNYRIAIESQNVDRIGTAGDFFICPLPAGGIAWPAPHNFRIAKVGAPGAVPRYVSLAWQPVDDVDGSSLEGYTIYVQVKNESEASITGFTAAPDAGSYFVPGSDTDHFDLVLHNSLAEATHLTVWIEARSFNGGRATVSAPLVVDLNLASSPADGVPFWQRRAFFVGIAAALFGVVLIVCGASVCILVHLRTLTERWEKRKLDEENAEIEREFFNAADDMPSSDPGRQLIRTTIGSSWLARFRRISGPNMNKSKDVTVVTAVNTASLSSSPLVPHRGVHCDTLEEDIEDSISLAVSQAGQVVHDNARIPVDLRDSKGGANGCEPAGCRRFRQRLQEDAEFRQACLAAARQRRSAGRIPSAATTGSLSLAHLSRWRVDRWHRSRRTASCVIEALPVTVAAAVPLISAPVGRRVDHNAMQTIIIEMADLSGAESIWPAKRDLDEGNVMMPISKTLSNKADSINLTNCAAVINCNNDNVKFDCTTPTSVVDEDKEKQSHEHATIPTISTAKPFSDYLPADSSTTDAAATLADRLAQETIKEALLVNAFDALAHRLVVDALRFIFEIDGLSNESQSARDSDDLPNGNENTPSYDQSFPKIVVGDVAPPTPPTTPTTLKNGITSDDTLLYQNGCKIVAESDCNRNGPTAKFTVSTVSNRQLNGFYNNVTAKKHNYGSNIDYRINDDNHVAYDNNNMNNNNNGYSINGYKKRTKFNSKPTRHNNNNNYYRPKNNKRNYNCNFHTANSCLPPAAIAPPFRATATGEP